MIDLRLLSRRPAWSLVFVASLTGIAVGCGGGNAATNTKGMTKPRVAVSGKVQFDGKPLAFGVISFTSKDTGNSASTSVKDGSFACKVDEGPNAGANVVSIAGKESADGPPVWIWSSKLDIPADGLTSGEFTVDSSKTKPAPKPTPDD